MYDRRDTNGTELRAVAGNFLFSTGANEFAGRYTAGHFDIPVMGTTIAAVQALCPLCGSPVLSVGRTGTVFAEDLRPIQLGPELGRGYTLCDDCGLLAHLPSDLTLN
jgi:hypothetical protein